MIFVVNTLRNIKGLLAEEIESDEGNKIREEAFLQLEKMRKNVSDLNYGKELAEYRKGRYGTEKIR